MKRILVLFAVPAALLWSAVAFAQAPEATATWSAASRPLDTNEYEIIFTGKILSGWHTYAIDHPYNPISIEFEESADWSASGRYQLTEPSEFDGEKVFFGEVKSPKSQSSGAAATIRGADMERLRQQYVRGSGALGILGSGGFRGTLSG